MPNVSFFDVNERLLDRCALDADFARVMRDATVCAFSFHQQKKFIAQRGMQ